MKPAEAKRKIHNLVDSYFSNIVDDGEIEEEDYGYYLEDLISELQKELDIQEEGEDGDEEELEIEEDEEDK